MKKCTTSSSYINSQISNRKFPHAYMATKLRIYEVCVINISMRHATVFQCYALLLYLWLEKVDKGDTWVCLLICTHKARALSFFSIPPPPLSALQLLVAEHFTKPAYMQCCKPAIRQYTIYIHLYPYTLMQCCKPAIRQEGNSQAPRPGTCPAHFGQGVHEAIFCPFLLSTLE